MRIKSILLLIAATVITAAAQNNAPMLSWTESVKDVYIDGQLDRNSQVFFCDAPKRMALISPKLDFAVILNQDNQTISTTLKELFQITADHTRATSDSGAPLQQVGSYALIDTSTYLFVIDGRAVMFRSHSGARGELSEQQLWETVPVWRYLMEGYEPNASAVSSIKADDKDTSVTIALGTWCPDSRNYVPKLFKALRAAGNGHIKVNIIGVDNQFHEPIDTIQKLKLVNVPTVIVERGGREIGRIIETPATETVEEDLAAILAGKAITHKGRWDRAGLVARGVYAYKDSAGKDIGREEWELFKTDEKGYLAHSRITEGDTTTEVWHRVNSASRPTFVEVTKQRGEAVIRTRYRLNDRTFTARMRSNKAGVIDQTLDVSGYFSVRSPSVAAEGWEFTVAALNQKQSLSYFAPSEFDGTVGSLTQMSFEEKPAEAVQIPAGQFRARHLIRSSGNETSEWWLHSELGIPVRAKSAGVEYVLTSIEVSPRQ